MVYRENGRHRRRRILEADGVGDSARQGCGDLGVQAKGEGETT